MAVKIEKGSALDSLSLTPLIDIVFLLLIFFLVATHFAEEERSLRVDLPDASEAQPLTAKPQEMIVNIKREGEFFVRGTTVTPVRLRELMRQEATKHPGSTVTIRTDKNAAAKHFAYVANLCKKFRLSYKLATK
jgi:biopolymer transport protein ExbD